MVIILVGRSMVVAGHAIAASTVMFQTITGNRILMPSIMGFDALSMLTGSPFHRFILPAAGMIAVITLIAGQLVLERVFTFNTSLSIIIEFAGGITFIVLLLRREAK